MPRGKAPLIKIENPRALTAHDLNELLQVGRTAGVSQLVVQADGGFQAIFAPPEPTSTPIKIEGRRPLTAHDLKAAEESGDLYGAVE